MLHGKLNKIDLKRHNPLKELDSYPAEPCQICEISETATGLRK